MGGERLQRAVGGREHDGVDEAPDGLGGLTARFGALERLGQPRHLLAVQVRLARVEQWQRLALARELGLQDRLSFLGGIPLDLQVRIDEAVLDRLDHPGDIVLDALELAFGCDSPRAVLHAEPVHLARELLAELLEQVLAEQLLFQRREHARFDLVALDGQRVAARAVVTCAEAGEPVGAAEHVPCAADPALRQAGEEVLGPIRGRERAGGAHDVSRARLPFLGRGPQVVGHDPELRNVLHDPLGLRVDPRDALAGVRVLDEPLPVPDQASDVQLVVQQAGAALRAPVDRAGTPLAAEWSRHGLTVQRLRDPLGGVAGDELAEHAFDDRGLARLDFALAGRQLRSLHRLDDPVAVAEPAAGLAVFDPPPQTSVRLLSEILEEQGVHRALEADVQVRDVALGERDDVHAGEREALEESGRVFLVAAEPVERLGEHDVEPPVQRIAHQRLEPRAQERCT